MLNCSDKTVVFSSILPPEPMTSENLYLNSLVVDCNQMENQGYALLSTNVIEIDQKLDELAFWV